MIGLEQVLVLGAAGFLGTAISRHCLAQGLSTIGVDVAAPVADVAFAKFSQTSNLEEDLGPLLARFQPGYLVNVAGNADVSKSVRDPRDDFRRAADLFSIALEQVRLHSPGTRVLLASSAAIYGQPARLPVMEAEAPAPISPYGYHKWMCELLTKEYNAVYGIKTASMRVFSAYGAGLRKQILWDLCSKCAGGGAVELGGDGTESRDFIHATDIAHATLSILRGGEFAGEAYNVASGKEVSISELAQLVLEEFGVHRGRLKFTGFGRVGDPKNWRADIGLLSSLGFRQSVDLRHGVAEYVQWFKRQ